MSNNTALNTRTDNALLAMASDVTTSLPHAFRQGNARDAARALLGVAAWTINRIGLHRMQECMSDLARHEPAWKPESFMRALPTSHDGKVDEWIAMVATVVSPLGLMLGAGNLRSAMAWWATERDTAAWQAIVGA